MTDKPISREKLLARLTGSFAIPPCIEERDQYLYITGRNSVATNLIVGILFGEFDESPAPVISPLEIMKNWNEEHRS